MTQQTSSVAAISIASAGSVLTAQPDCSDPLNFPAECLKFSTDGEYRFNFTGNATWKCLVPEKCGLPKDIIKPT